MVRAWPLELVNGTPMDAARTAEHIAHLREEVAPELFAGFTPARFPTSTLPALALVASAYRCGLQVGELMSFAVRDALFEEGLDISNPQVIQGLADRLSVPLPTAADHDRVLADWSEGRERGVVGSPHFFAGAESAFCPALTTAHGSSAGAPISLELDRLAVFLGRALAG